MWLMGGSVSCTEGFFRGPDSPLHRVQRRKREGLVLESFGKVIRGFRTIIRSKTLRFIVVVEKAGG
jgi:hypothetical protein